MSSPVFARFLHLLPMWYQCAPRQPALAQPAGPQHNHTIGSPLRGSDPSSPVSVSPETSCSSETSSVTSVSLAQTARPPVTAMSKPPPAAAIATLRDGAGTVHGGQCPETWVDHAAWVIRVCVRLSSSRWYRDQPALSQEITWRKIYSLWNLSWENKGTNIAEHLRLWGKKTCWKMFNYSTYILLAVLPSLSSSYPERLSGLPESWRPVTLHNLHKRPW